MAITNRALAFASRWFDEATVRRTFEPLIADWQREWHDASGARRPWVSLRGLSAFICAVAISSPTIVATPVPPSISWRVATRIAMFCVVIAGALSIPMLRSRDPIEQEAPLWAAMLLMAIPAALTIAFPFAMVVAVDAIRRDAGVAPQVERAAALKLGGDRGVLHAGRRRCRRAARESRMARTVNACRLEYSAAALATAVDSGAAHSPGAGHGDRARPLHASRRDPPGIDPPLGDERPARDVRVVAMDRARPATPPVLAVTSRRDDGDRGRGVCDDDLCRIYSGVQVGLAARHRAGPAADRLWFVDARRTAICATQSWRARAAAPHEA